MDAAPIGTPTSTKVVFQQPETGAVTTATGFGFGFDALGNIISGTITGLSFAQSGTTVATFSDISWAATTFYSALAAGESGNNAPLDALLNATPVTIDGSASTVRMLDIGDFYNFTADVTIKGSEFNDILAAGSGNDTIWFGNGDGAFARATAGNDTMVFTDVTTSYSFLIYASSSRAGGITATINGTANTGSIIKADGVDTIIDVKNPLAAGWVDGGFQLIGTRNADVFNMEGGTDTWMRVEGADGNDVFNLTMTGWIRLDFNWNGREAATQALNINVGAGTVANDGYGFTDTLNVTPGEGVLQIRATDFADTLVGSDAREDFILEQGNDTVDGGGGNDRVRYDRSGVGAVVVDLAAGTATGTWDGFAFRDQLTSIESVRGSRDDGDILKGSGKANTLDGKGGNDTLYGRNGKDELWDGAGDDTVYGGGGNDIFHNGGGEDTFIGGKGRDTFIDDSTKETIVETNEFNMVTGVHRVLADEEFRDSISGIENYTMLGNWGVKVTGNNSRNVINTDLGDDWVSGNGGNDKISTRGGSDTLLGGGGRDKLSGGFGKDVLKGGAGIDTLEGGNGKDKLTGGGGDDVFLFQGSVSQGRDVITDFNDGSDVIRVVGGSGVGFDDVTLTAIAGGGSTLVELSGGTKIVLRGVDIALIDANDFDFV